MWVREKSYKTYLKEIEQSSAHRKKRKKREVVRDIAPHKSIIFHNLITRLSVYVFLYSWSVCVLRAVGHITRFPCLSVNEASLVYTSHLLPYSKLSSANLDLHTDYTVTSLSATVCVRACGHLGTDNASRKEPLRKTLVLPESSQISLSTSQ